MAMGKKPAPNFGCEAEIELNGTFTCGKPGVARDDMPFLKWHTIMCDDCYAKAKEKR